MSAFDIWWAEVKGTMVGDKLGAKSAFDLAFNAGRVTGAKERMRMERNRDLDVKLRNILVIEELYTKADVRMALRDGSLNESVPNFGKKSREKLFVWLNS